MHIKFLSVQQVPCSCTCTNSNKNLISSVFISDLNSPCNEELCFYFNFLSLTIVFPNDILTGIHLILTHVMRTVQNSHKSMFLTALCSANLLVYKATIVLHTVNRSCFGRTFQHEAERTGYFKYNGVRYYQ